MPSRTETTFAPPVMEARRWLEGVRFPRNAPLINVSQAAPVDPPPDALRQVMAEAVLQDDSAHLYGPVLGLPALRSALAGQMSDIYGQTIEADAVAITSGCNQAFAATLASLCSEADEVILPTPWYFNHKMWLDMSGIRAVPLPTQADLLPDPDQARALITPRTKAIALVTPNNPAGVEYPDSLMEQFFDLAAAHGLALIVDETYRDFDSRAAPPHRLFQRPDWDRTLVHLYSFSKAYRLTGHRVGAMVAAPQRLAEAEKFLDTVAICPGQVGQRAALWGIGHLQDWVAGERDEILARRQAILDNAPKLEQHGWQVLGLGAYFAYMRHPFQMRSDALAPWLVKHAGILCLPGTMFRPDDDLQGGQELRIAFANADRAGIADLFDRFAAIDLQTL